MEIFYSEDFISYPDPDRSLGSRRISDSTGMRNSGFYTGSRSFMVCNPEFSDAKVRYGCDSYDPSGTAGYHIRAYWTSGCDKQNHRKRLVNRPGTSDPCSGIILNNGIRTDRIQYRQPHMEKKYRSYGSDDKVYSVRVSGAAVLSIICSFVGKLSMIDDQFRRCRYRRNLVPLYGMIRHLVFVFW